nr:acyltransferase [Enterobacter hormaechei]
MNKLNSLTSFRFFAAFFVLIGHAAYRPGFESFGTDIVSFYNSVSFFFVLSGFILSYNYMNSTKGYFEYLASRIARIWPLHIFMLIIWALLIYKGIPSGSESSLLSNIMLIQSWVLQDKMTLSYNLVSWSVSVEFAFYLLFPALLVATKKFGPLCLLLPVLIPIAVVAYSSSKGIDFFSPTGGTGVYSMLYTNPLSRVIEFSFGILAFIVYDKVKAVKMTVRTATTIELSAIAILMCSMGAANHLYLWLKQMSSVYEYFGYWYTTAGSFVWMGLVIGVFAMGKGIISRFLSWNGFVYLGEISFSLYMCHFFILELFTRNLSEFMLSHNFLSYFCFVLSTILTSSFLFHAIENPCMRIIKNLASVHAIQKTSTSK